MKIHVYLKGGSDFAVSVTDFEVLKDEAGRFQGVTWNPGPMSMSEVVYLNALEIAAIVQVGR